MNVRMVFRMDLINRFSPYKSLENCTPSIPWVGHGDLWAGAVER